MRKSRKNNDVSSKDTSVLSKTKSAPREGKGVFGGIILFFVLIGVVMILFFLSKYVGFI